jgi:hypothetical protein
MWELFSGYNGYGGKIMWIKEKKILELIKEIDKLKEKINNFVACETCGCLLIKKDAIRGNSKIILVQDERSILYSLKEVIHHPYYCKRHAPKAIYTEEEE